LYSSTNRSIPDRVLNIEKSFTKNLPNFFHISPYLLCLFCHLNPIKVAIHSAIDGTGHRLDVVLVSQSVDLPVFPVLTGNHNPNISPGDQFWIDGLPQQSKMFGFPPAEPFTPTRWLDDGDGLTLGESRLTVRHCPGHTPGHVVFHSAEAKRCFVGDVLFAGSIGRTDFPGGDHDTLIASITQRLWPMGDATVFIPGHGPESTFGRERRSNPYVGGT